VSLLTSLSSNTGDERGEAEGDEGTHVGDAVE
jgi:hypothetical protein